MAPHRIRSFPDRGFSLIELLVVLVVLGILAMVGVTQITPKSPKATRAVLLDLRNAVQNARQAAVSSGRNVRIRFENVGGNWQVRALDTSLAETSAAAAFFSMALPPDAMNRCSLATAFGSLPTTATKVTDLAPASAYGFGPSTAGWAQPLVGQTTYGFAPDGSAVLFTGASPNPSVSALIGGFWAGVVGNTPNSVGVPYGVVLVSQQGQIVTYYKGDSQLDDTHDHIWARLE